MTTELPRRSLLAGIASLSASRAAMGSVDAVSFRAQAIRSDWERRQRELTVSFVPDGRFDVDDPVIEELRAVGAGFSAVHAVHDLAEVPIEDQAHPSIQALLHDATAAFGEATLRCRALVRTHLEREGGGDGEQLRDALRVLRLSTADWDLSDRRRRLLSDAFTEAEDPTDPRAQRKLSRAARRVDKLERLARRAADEGRADDLLGAASADADAAARRGVARHGRARRRSGSVALSVGGIILGVALAILGGILILAGICSLACGEAVGVLLLLAGLALVGLAIWAITGLSAAVQEGISTRAGRPTRWATAEAPSDARAPGVAVHADCGWVDTDLVRSADRPLRLRARGRVYGPWGWLASPNGDGVAAGPGAPLPGAPELAVVAEVGGERFFIGADGEIPAGPAGAVRLRLNLDPKDASAALGFFHVAPA